MPSQAGPAPTASPALTVEEALSAMNRALDELPAGSGPGLTFLGALKAVWSKARAHTQELNRERGGRVAGEYLSDVTDRVLRRLLEFAGQRVGMHAGTSGIALLALGS